MHLQARFIIRKFLSVFIVLALVVLAITITFESSYPESSYPESVGGAGGFVTVEIEDTTVSAEDSIYSIGVYLSNSEVEVGGFQIRILLNRPDLILYPDSLAIDTVVACILGVCDTLVDTFTTVPMQLSESVFMNWELVHSKLIAPTALQFTAIYSLGAGSGGIPIPANSGPQLLFRIYLKRIMPSPILDTLQDRTVDVITLEFPFAEFSTPTGERIGIRDSVRCLNPPLCDQIDTINVEDNIYFSGSVTILPSVCVLGDVNSSGSITSSDIIALVNYVFKSGNDLACANSTGDVNCLGGVTSSDIIFLVNYVFKGGPAPTCI